jgi:hypothetical protein
MRTRSISRDGLAVLLVTAGACGTTVQPATVPRMADSSSRALCPSASVAPASPRPSASVASLASATSAGVAQYPPEATLSYRRTVVGEFAHRSYRYTFTLRFGPLGALDLDELLERSMVAVPAERDWTPEDHARFSGTSTLRDGRIVEGALAPTDCGHCAIPPTGRFPIDCIPCARGRLTCLRATEFVFEHEAHPAACFKKPSISGRPIRESVIACVWNRPDLKSRDDWFLTPEGLDDVFESWDDGSCGHLLQRMR